jgi:hypothetical protein
MWIEKHSKYGYVVGPDAWINEFTWDLYTCKVSNTAEEAQEILNHKIKVFGEHSAFCECVIKQLQSVDPERMNNKELATRIYESLNRFGAGLGNASTNIIEKELDSADLENAEQQYVIDNSPKEDE